MHTRPKLTHIHGHLKLPQKKLIETRHLVTSHTYQSDSVKYQEHEIK